MSTRVFAASVIAALLSTSTVAAVSVTNRDDRDYKVTVIEGDAQKDHVLKPTQMIEGVCQKGCIIRLNDSKDDEYELEGSEVVSIEEGYLYYDGPELSTDPAPGEVSKPSAPGGEAAPPPQPDKK